MGAADQIHVVFLQEPRHNIRPESKRDPPIVFTPASDIFVGIGPQEVTQQATVRNLKESATFHRCGSKLRNAFQMSKNRKMNGEFSVTYIGGPHHAAYLFHGIQIWAQAPVHGENFFINDGGDRKAIEAISKSLPKLDIVSSLALIVKSINTIDRCALVVTTEDKEILWVFDFVREEQADRLK